ncbi:MAG: GNAT family N-acetyltransferase [Gammaproteobacteria bacterium]|nr:GNAT family N-acetyltransferase [Gammaproteobacteria bacterium]
MQDMVIHECFPEVDEEDLEQLLKAYLRIWNSPENLRFLSFTGLPFEASGVSAWFSSRINEGVHYYAASIGGALGGIAVVRMDRIRGVELLGIGVEPERKGQGVGTALIEHVVSVARDQGFRALEALVFADNVTMLRLLLSLSFIPVDMEHHRRPDGADLLRMQRMV